VFKKDGTESLRKEAEAAQKRSEELQTKSDELEADYSKKEDSDNDLSSRVKQLEEDLETGPVVDSDDEEVDTKKLIEAFYQDPTEAKIVELWELDLWSQVSKGIPELEQEGATRDSKEVYEGLMAAPDMRAKLENPSTLGKKKKKKMVKHYRITLNQHVYFTRKYIKGDGTTKYLQR
jgi:hypothetical protein